MKKTLIAFLLCASTNMFAAAKSYIDPTATFCLLDFPEVQDVGEHTFSPYDREMNLNPLWYTKVIESIEIISKVIRDASDGYMCNLKEKDTEDKHLPTHTHFNDPCDRFCLLYWQYALAKKWYDSYKLYSEARCPSLKVAIGNKLEKYNRINTLFKDKDLVSRLALKTQALSLSEKEVAAIYSFAPTMKGGIPNIIHLARMVKKSKTLILSIENMKKQILVYKKQIASKT